MKWDIIDIVRHKLNMNELSTAIIGNQLEVVRQLVNNASLKSIDLNRGLWTAVYYKQTAIVEYLLHSGAKPMYGICAYTAAQNGCLEILKLLITHSQDSLSMYESQRCESLPIYGAVNGGHLDVIEYLLSLYDFTNPDMQRILNKCLNIAVYCRYVHLVDYLLDKGAEIQPSLENGMIMDPLEKAVYYAIPEMVNHLINRGADINGTSGKILEYAINQETMDVLQALLEPQKYIPDCPTKVKGIRLGYILDLGIWSAIGYGKLDMLRYLLSFRKTQNVSELIEWAGKDEDSDVVNYLKSLL